MRPPMPDQENDLRAAYREWSRRRTDPGRASCPEPHRILELVEGTGSEEERLPILDHVMQCEECRREFDMLRAVHQAGPRRWQGIPPWLSLAASVVLLCGIGYGAWAYSSGESPSSLRGSGGTLGLLRPGAGSFSEDTLTFIWSSQPGAVGYTLEILDVDGRSLFSRKTGDTVVTIDLNTMPSLKGELRWWVRAQGADGVERGSELRPLSIPERPPPPDFP